MRVDGCIHLLTNSGLSLLQKQKMCDVLLDHGIEVALDFTATSAHLSAYRSELLEKKLQLHRLANACTSRQNKLKIIPCLTFPLLEANIAIKNAGDFILPHTKITPFFLSEAIFGEQEEVAYRALMHHGYSPLLTNPEIFFLFASEKDAKRVLALPKISFLWKTSAFLNPRYSPIFAEMLQNKKKILLGSDAKRISECGFPERSRIPKENGLRMYYSYLSRLAENYFEEENFT